MQRNRNPGTSAQLSGFTLNYVHLQERETRIATSPSWDLIVTMDDATNEHYSMFLCEEEGTWSSLRGVRETIEAKGLFCSLYTDRARTTGTRRVAARRRWTVRDSRARRRAGQLRAVRADGDATARGPAPAALHQGQGEGPPPRGRYAVGVAWAAQAGRVRLRRRAACRPLRRERSSWGDPPFAHRASSTSGTGAVDKAWITPPPLSP